ncbi:hypothetical protein BH11BAC3_BH11BAC3_05590 [soil metagenome]
MENLFDSATYNEVVDRLNKLGDGSTRQWGKMDVGQMMAHCCAAFRVPLTQKKLPRMILGRLISWMIKSKMYNDEPWKQNLPTAPEFIIKDQKDFEMEKGRLKELIDRFYHAGPDGISKYPHPFFGSFTPEQWGQSMYKHLDHHFIQFSA